MQNLTSSFRPLAAISIRPSSFVVKTLSKYHEPRVLTLVRSYTEKINAESEPKPGREPPRTAPRSRQQQILMQQMQQKQGREQFQGKQHQEETVDDQPDRLVPRYRSPEDRKFERKAIGIVVVFFLTFIPFLYWYYPIRLEQVRARRERVMREVAESRALYNEGRR